ncbi:trypsin-like serine protease [Brevundimonas sp.]|uniref:trypsin-like serine peptidase n=1 Tax=Brevundimonas sp. TaxID=1871086 RepID=UPI0025C60639|nr:trypsin-like serine protease [Brevundimonas sp.]
MGAALIGSAEAEDADFLMLPPAPPTPGPEILGGEKSDPKAWPATLRFDGPGGTLCTATLVGARVILTASHCMRDGAVGRAFIIDDWVDVRCEPVLSDVTLCLIVSPFVPPEGLRFERLSANTPPLRVSDALLLQGYGCVTPEGTRRGELFQGGAVVETLPGRWPIIRTRGGAAVCPGDSGGPAYRVFSARRREIVGLNTAGDQVVTSEISAIAHAEVRAVISTWASAPGRAICGINERSELCHD